MSADHCACCSSLDGRGKADGIGGGGGGDVESATGEARRLSKDRGAGERELSSVMKEVLRW